jgi:beta-1,4-N-acetylglucosaminyltransferase
MMMEMQEYISLVNTSLLLFVILIYRIYSCLCQTQNNDISLSLPKKNVKTMVFFGSGGHTMEMIRLIKHLSPEKYHPICFGIGHTDITSIEKVRSANLLLEQNASWLRIYRNREVKQSWITTIFTSMWSFIQSFWVIHRYRPELLICNGPGTCLSLCYSAFILNVLGITGRTKIIFVESFCRVNALSLTGKLIMPIANKFIVQWPELVHVVGGGKGSKVEYIGTIC